MKIIEQIDIKNRSDMIYAKTVLKNILKHQRKKYDESFLIFALMELSTNLIKHADGGEIWILKSDNEILIASLDYGKGIKDISWATKKGVTSLNNSLGLGLYQLKNSDYYTIDIFSLSKKEFHGTIVLLKPRDFKKSIISLQQNYIGEHISGDMFAKKGKFLILADGSGHGKKANQTVQFIKSFFYNNSFSCLLIDEFFQKLHNQIKEKMLRGAVMAIFEVTKNSVQICSVGNISIWYKKGKNYFSIKQKNGIIGEVFSSIAKEKIELSKETKILATTDGLDINKIEKILSIVPQNISSELLALTLIHFASVKSDDKSVIIIQKEEE